MCGRFVLFTTETLLDSVAGLGLGGEVHAPYGLPPARYNIAPTQQVAIVRLAESVAQVDPARWGLLPGWKKDETGPPLFNARAETVASKPSFRATFAGQRCLIPLDGYYEWHDDGTGKAPYYVTLGDEPLWAAGLWDTGVGRLSATMVTTDATEEMAWLHHRLPRFLACEEMEQWLLGTKDEAAELLHPTGLRGFNAAKADPAVGNVRNDYPELIGR